MEGRSIISILIALILCIQMISAVSVHSPQEYELGYAADDNYGLYPVNGDNVETRVPSKRAQTFVRFGKRAQTFVRFGKRAQTFVRFG
uniref:Neuropeptide-Like Protein n=1 Tax=Rhabditophanes sp. KR3021 TaxID=114890 RepID=A0AC35U6M7_9BILA